MTEFNLDLGKKVLNQVTLDPGSHHQSDPESCIMGWSVRLGDGSFSHYCSTASSTSVIRSTNEGRAQLLGITPRRAAWIYNTPFNFVARHHLARLVAREERRRDREARRIAKRAARVEKETQAALDLQARAQLAEFRCRSSRKAKGELQHR